MPSTGAVAAFEDAFAQFVGAKFAVSCVNGTATLHAALVALGVNPGDTVSVPCITMAATTAAVLHGGAIPQFVDIDPETWLMQRSASECSIPVSLFGLCFPHAYSSRSIDDAAQTLRRHGASAFTSYSFQASKIISTGEGGMLVTNSEELATRAREFGSLGYRMNAKQPRIDSATLKSPTFNRHHSLGWNYRMAPAVAEEGLKQLARAEQLLAERRQAAEFYVTAISGCSWIHPQSVPNAWRHDNWAFAVALESKELWQPFVDSICRNGGERPYACWRVTYQEPAFRHLAPDGTCPNAEELQPRLVQFQTNDIQSAEKNAHAVMKAIGEIG
ncbi:MAG: DegT/DnrJ/EryC1/StrS family aminotransferase [Gemmatimonadaceae bacterium]